MPVNRVELLRLDVQALRWKEEAVSLKLQFNSALGRFEFSFFIPLVDENQMVTILFAELLSAYTSFAKSRNILLSEAVLENKQGIALLLRRFLRQYREGRKKEREGKLELQEEALLLANGLDFVATEKSLDGKKNEERVEILFGRAKQCYYEEAFEHCLQFLEKILKIDPLIARAYYLQGLCYRELGFLPSAVEAFLCWQKLTPPLKKEPYLLLGDLYLALDESEKGLELYARYMQQFPDDPRGCIEYGQFLYRKKDPAFWSYLERASKMSLELLQEELKTRWVYELPESDPLRWIGSAEMRVYLRMEKSALADLVRKRIIPSHFCEENCTYFFDREEVDLWVEIMNRFSFFKEPIQRFSKQMQRKILKSVRVLKEREEQHQLTLWSQAPILLVKTAPYRDLQ